MKPYGIEVHDVYSELNDGFIIDKMVQLIGAKASQHGGAKKSKPV